MCAGVGKTYDMLKAAHIQKSKSVDVVIGSLKHTGGRKPKLSSKPAEVQRKGVEYKGTSLEEMDLDALLARKPALFSLMSLRIQMSRQSAYETLSGCARTSRQWIDVYTTLNVQHLESRADTVAQITGTIVRETVPDSILEVASEVELIDIPPDELVKRLEEGKVYTANDHVRPFRISSERNLTALREMALRLTAERVDHQLRDLMKSQGIAGPWNRTTPHCRHQRKPA